MTARRSRRRGPSSTPASACLALAVVLVALSMVTPVTSFTTGGADRHPAADVVDDVDAALGIDGAAAVHTTGTCRLVTVTNRFDQTLDVTVALRDDSAQYGTLVVGGVEQGNETTASLAGGDSTRVDVSVDDGSDGETLYYHVTADGRSVDVTANDRSTAVDDNATAECS